MREEISEIIKEEIASPEDASDLICELFREKLTEVLRNAEGDCVFFRDEYMQDGINALIDELS